MLIGARDRNGSPRLFKCDREANVSQLYMIDGGQWSWNGMGVINAAWGDDAEPFCRNIPPGEKRVIDLEKSVIVHVAPPKTPVEELVETCEKLLDGSQGCLIDGRPACFVRGGDCVDLRTALARVKEAK